MSLVVEDGSVVEDANSYASVLDARLYATARGVALPDDDSAVEALLIQAMDYVESKRDKFQGYKASPSQKLQWPRTNVILDREPFPDDEIPSELVWAQAQLAIDAMTTPLFTTSPNSRSVIKERVDVIETAYAAPQTSGAESPSFRKAESWLRPLYTATSFGTYRI